MGGVFGSRLDTCMYHVVDQLLLCIRSIYATIHYTAVHHAVCHSWYKMHAVLCDLLCNLGAT